MRERLMAMLSGAFALLAGLRATVGLYGVIAYMVARRKNEIGVRIALGADRGRVIRLVLWETTLLLGAGLAAGVVIALLAAVGLAAGYGPARRAAAWEPMARLTRRVRPPPTGLSADKTAESGP